MYPTAKYGSISCAIFGGPVDYSHGTNDDPATPDPEDHDDWGNINLGRVCTDWDVVE